MPTRTQLVLVLAIAAAACKGGAPAQPAPPPLECTLALLKTGPRTEPLTDDERKQIFGGHFANMMRLATEGLLLVAGPYGKVKTDPALRGLFIFDTNDPARARQIAETDPGFQAGVFQFELHALSTHARLREQMAAELAATDPNAAPGASIRGYVLLTADDGTRAMHALADHRAVLMSARLDTTKALVLLDAADAAAANKLLAPHAEQIGRFQLDEWAASKLMVELPKREPAGAGAGG